MSFADDLQKRLHQWSLDVIRFCRTLPQTDEGRHIGDQLRRAATSASANYRASRRGRSRAEWLAKLGTVVEELDEAEHWLAVIVEAAVAEPSQNLTAECRSLRAILATSRATARAGRPVPVRRTR